MPEVALKEIATPVGVAKVPMTAVETLTARHLATGTPFNVQNKTHFSARPLVFNRVEQRPTLNPTQAYYKLDGRQVIRFFNYAEGDNIQTGTLIAGNQVERRADYADTSLTDSRYTPNNTDLAINAISFGQRNICVQYSEADITAAIAASGGGTLNDSVLSALRGVTPILDPASVVTSPQIGSPSNLQNAFESFLKPFSKLELQWNGNVRAYLGQGHHFTHGMGKSHLESQGDALLSNVFAVPEGYLWNNKGFQGGDQEMELLLENVRDLVAVLTLPTSPLLGGFPIPPGFPVQAFPERVIVWVLAYIHCNSFNPVSSNNG